MDVNDVPNPEAPDLNQPTGDTGAGFQSEDNNAPAPGTPEYLGHMAKRGGASEEEVAMIIAAAQKNDPNPKENTDADQTGETDGDDQAGDADDQGSDQNGQDQGDGDQDQDDGDGLTLEGLQNEVTENGGKLSDDTMSKLEGMGFDRKEVEKYIDTQYKLAQAEATRVSAEVYSEVGGKERYLEMIEWAGDNLSMKEVKGINADLRSGDLAKVKDAMGRLDQRFTAKNGNPPRKIQRGTKKSNAQSADVFRSQSELSAAMNDPRYKKDPAYRNDVALKLKRSPAFRMG